MADYRVIANGNISNYATVLYNITAGGAATSLPTVGDNVYMNNFTLQLIDMEKGINLFITPIVGEQIFSEVKHSCNFRVHNVTETEMGTCIDYSAPTEVLYPTEISQAKLLKILEAIKTILNENE